PERSPTPRKATIQRPWPVASKRRDRSPTSDPGPVVRTEPGATRSERLVISSTTSSPLMPWGLTMRPTSSTRLVDDVDDDLGALAGTGGPDHGPDGLGRP